MRLAHFVLGLSLGVYIVCLVPESFCVEGLCDEWPGYGILLTGFLAVPLSWANAAWLANPLLFLAWVAAGLGWRMPAVALSVAAVALSGSFMFADTVVTNEAGLAYPITGLRLGYWLWLSSMAIALVGALLCAKQPQTSKTGV